MLVKRVALESQSLLDTDSPVGGQIQGERIRLAFTPWGKGQHQED